MLTFIEDFLPRIAGTNETIGKHLGVGGTMISNYKTGNYLPSIQVAFNLYNMYEVVVYPYSEEALNYYRENGE